MSLIPEHASSLTLKIDVQDLLAPILLPEDGAHTHATSFLNTVQPVLAPVYQRVCQRVKEWASQVTQSEVDHLILGILLGLCLVAAVIIACKVRQKRRAHPVLLTDRG